ncbi:lipid A biosynthesis acyltransferase [Polaribacter vadi]|uniref:Lipid A biosynthesis acyltransferase n=1 Tax=Polaribacter vadi TaxID=1774273 RepID=A0A1B8TZR3_9FLAO|nr:lysophospholipid acyltransferase family protein [Polaribacter vadi]AOW15970.1 lipid A biosynthesis acyltransferase [Polaribacter vadi]OBY65121.1 lipid A biosynthesis acyltransferase [Polaribacter vadi]
MNQIVFYLTYPLIWLISRLPMFILYLISDFFYVLLYYVFGYRKAVVLKNISYAFPGKSEEEKQKIAKKFYKHFTDIMIESIKSFSISEKEILKRYKYKNPELVNKYAKEGKSIALVSAHLANWEWSISTPLVLNIDIFGAYNKLRNETFEKTLRENREKFGIKGATTANFIKLIKHNFENNVQGAYILLSDQSPHIEKTFHWGTFFGVKVPVHTGAEMLAKKNDLVVINYRAKKIKRGYYETDFELITENPKDYKDYEITDKFLRITERNITEQPEFYLWSHKRFKHKDKYDEWLKLQETKQQTKS